MLAFLVLLKPLFSRFAHEFQLDVSHNLPVSHEVLRPAVFKVLSLFASTLFIAG